MIIGISLAALVLGLSETGDRLREGLQAGRTTWWRFVFVTLVLQWIHFAIAIRLARRNGIAEVAWKPRAHDPVRRAAVPLGFALLGAGYLGLVFLRFSGPLDGIAAEGLGPTARSLLPATLPEALAYLALALTAAVCEETVYRGFALGWLRRRVGAVAAIVVTAAAFAAAHGVWVDSLAADLAPRFLIGLVFGGLVVWRGHIGLAVLVHLILDANGVLFR